MADEIIEIEVETETHTDKALKVSVDGDNFVWVPRSQISDYTGDEPENPDSIFIPEWLALDKGLI